MKAPRRQVEVSGAYAKAERKDTVFVRRTASRRVIVNPAQG
jgi:hypothetical protein